jgi:hypothetical protein
LSNAAQVYQPQFFDQVFRQFRVYFNEIDNFLSNISGPYGGDYLTFSYGSFYDTTDQTAANTTTAYAVSFNSTDISQQVSIASSSQITFDVAGTLVPAKRVQQCQLQQPVWTACTQIVGGSFAYYRSG